MTYGECANSERDSTRWHRKGHMRAIPYNWSRSGRRLRSLSFFFFFTCEVSSFFLQSLNSQYVVVSHYILNFHRSMVVASKFVIRNSLSSKRHMDDENVVLFCPDVHFQLHLSEICASQLLQSTATAPMDGRMPRVFDVSRLFWIIIEVMWLI